MTGVEKMTHAVRRVEEVMSGPGAAMQSAASALTSFGKLYGDAIEVELARLKAVRQAHPRSRPLKRDA